MSDTTPVLLLDQIDKTYEAATEPVEVLHGVSLSLHPGESIAIAGPSGCGKSTLLNIAGTLDSPTAGHVWIAGRDLSDAGDAELAATRNQDIGFVFQLHHLLPQCTVLENVLLPTVPAGGTDDGAARAEYLLERVGLTARRDYRPARLSGGERQRAAVVRALINRPSLLLADEPTGSLDTESADQLVRLLVELNREENLAMVVVTHSEAVAAQMQRRYRLNEGRLDAWD